MTKKQFTPMWDHLRQANGIALRLVDLIPADKIDSHPIPNMRTPKELLVHLYAMSVNACAEGIARGEIVEPDEQKIVSEIKTKNDLVRFCRDTWTAADQAAQSVTDAQLASKVKTPWGMELPGDVVANVIRDEFFHHRGQLYAYTRQLGQVPPMVWDFEHNDPAFQPQTTAQA